MKKWAIAFGFLIVKAAWGEAPKTIWLWQTNSPQQLQDFRKTEQDFRRRRAICRLQIKSRLLPTACLELHLPKAKLEAACLHLEVAAIHYRALQMALRQPHWPSRCLVTFEKLMERKIYQLDDDHLGSTLEEAPENGDSSAHRGLEI